MKVGVLISGRGSNLRSLIEAQVRGQLSAEIVTVISNVPDAPGLEIAKSHGVRSEVINHKEFDSQKSFEETLNKALILADTDLICLAGFMRILSDNFVSKWKDRLINVHPSLLPSFKGLNTHERALKAGVCFTGCTIHFVRAAMDDGPIILQAAIPTLAQDTPETLANRVLEQEHIIFPLAVRKIAEGRVKVEGNVAKIESASFHSAPIINPFD